MSTPPSDPLAHARTAAKAGPSTRREFLVGAGALASGSVLAALAGGARIAQAAGLALKAAGPAKPLNILILGGTGFIGPHTIDVAKARGHSVTLFNRGRREKLVGARDGVEKLYGNRDPDKHAGAKVVDGKEVDDETTPKGLEELKGRTFDAVIDNSGFFPRHVKASAALLAPNVGQYVFVSTVSVYKSNTTPNADETDEIGTIEDPTVETMGAQSENYGPLKALCEKAVEEALPGRATIVRPGYIVGPGDTSDRFTYWPVRASRGGEILCPGERTDPVQFIDARDLAAWLVLLVERRTFGVMNATGPASRYTAGELLDACVAAAGKMEPPAPALTQTWVPYDALAELGCQPGVLPIILPSSGELAGFHSRSIKRALDAGLTFRSPEQTCRDLLAWWPEAVALRTRVGKEQAEQAEKEGRPIPKLPDPARLRAGISPEREAEILSAWKKSPKSGG